MKTRPHSVAGFSLVEVVIAVGIFAAGVTVILALLPALTRRAADSAAVLAALRLPDAVRVELQRLATTGGFNALANQATVMAAPLPDTLLLAASRDGAQLESISYLPPAAAQMAPDERFYLVEVWRFGPGPLAFDAAGAGMALHVRVSWPYRARGSAAETPSTDRDQVTFNLALSR